MFTRNPVPGYGEIIAQDTGTIQQQRRTCLLSKRENVIYNGKQTKTTEM